MEKRRKLGGKRRTWEDRGGKRRKAFCALFFRNQLIIFHISHHFHVKCVDFKNKMLPV